MVLIPERDRLAEVEITQEMIEAGVRVLVESGRLIEGLSSADWPLAEEVFAVMWQHHCDCKR